MRTNKIETDQPARSPGPLSVAFGTLQVVAMLTVCLGLSGCVSPPVTAPTVVLETDVTPVVVDEYYLVGGLYYYWHPGINQYVALQGRPPEGYLVVRMNHLSPSGPGPAIRPQRPSKPITGPGPQINPYQPHTVKQGPGPFEPRNIVQPRPSQTAMQGLGPQKKR
jgi:hypothetical protein